MEYCLGFAFDETLDQVILIQKTKPEWQAGLWNGVGGKIEFGEKPIEAVQREFQEETGIETEQNQWVFFRLELFKASALHMFATQLSNFWAYKTVTEERVYSWTLDEIADKQIETIPNLSYLVPMAKYWLEHPRENLPITGRTLNDFC